MKRCVMASSHREHRQDKTVLSCLVSVHGVNWIGDKTRLSATENFETLLSSNAVWTESCLVLTQFPIRYLETGSRVVHKCVHTADKTKLFCLRYIEICLRLSRTQFTPPTRQDRTVLSCQCSRCELAIRLSVDIIRHYYQQGFCTRKTRLLNKLLMRLLQYRYWPSFVLNEVFLCVINGSSFSFFLLWVFHSSLCFFSHFTEQRHTHLTWNDTFYIALRLLLLHSLIVTDYLTVSGFFFGFHRFSGSVLFLSLVSNFHLIGGNNLERMLNILISQGRN